LLTEKTPIALHKLNQETLDIALEVRRHQIYTIPSSEIDRTKIEPDLLTFRAIHRTHP
jgi:hypothetical protein